MPMCERDWIFLQVTYFDQFDEGPEVMELTFSRRDAEEFQQLQRLMPSLDEYRQQLLNFMGVPAELLDQPSNYHRQSFPENHP